MKILLKALPLWFLLAACSHAPKEATSSADSRDAVQSTTLPTDPHSPLLTEQPAKENESVRRNGIVLVLGPGMARGLSYAGVLIELEKQKIPVAAIVGVEMGALVGALHYSSRTTHALEWTLKRLEEKNILGSQYSLQKLFGGKEGGAALDDYLKTKIASSFPSNAKHLGVGVFFTDRNEDVILTEGSLREAVRASMAVPGLISDGKVMDRLAHSSNRISPFPIEKAKELGWGPIVAVSVVDVTTGGVLSEDSRAQYIRDIQTSARHAEDELEEAHLILRPEVSTIGYFEFEKRASAIFKGKQVVRNHIQELKTLIEEASGESSE